MPVTRDQLMLACDEILNPSAFQDYCPNGLQVQGKESIQKLVCGVTANQALIDRAVEENADALLVHHGFFWKGEGPVLTGIKYQRIKALIKHDINLIAYHLPLDAHPEWGNNMQLANLLGLEVMGGLDPLDGAVVGNVGQLPATMAAEDFCRHISKVLDREPLLITAGGHAIKKVGWCTGSAPGYIEQAAARGVDAYISGEISEPAVHTARELGVHYIAAGHHATERYGVQALGRHLAERFGLDYQYIDIDSPV